MEKTEALSMPTCNFRVLYLLINPVPTGYKPSHEDATDVQTPHDMVSDSMQLGPSYYYYSNYRYVYIAIDRKGLSLEKCEAI